jgi:CBS-domain-containing membrane protein
MLPDTGTSTAGAHGGASAYAAIAGEGAREPLKIVQDVMHQPVVSVSIDASVGEAWQELLRHGVGQAPVVDRAGRLVGLIGRAELLPVPALISGMAKASSLQALLTEPVATVMWSPVPAAQPDTELRRAAALLLATGLPGVPVTDSNGHLLAFVSRSDLLQAMVTDPPLDLWG